MLKRRAAWTACAAFCLVGSGCHSSTQNVNTLSGKWAGEITWNDASGRPYRQTMRTALFFLPHNVVGIVITFPTGAIGGAGKYTLKGSRLTVRCASLSVNGRPVPLSTFSHAPWYHSAASYTVRYDNGNLVLATTAAGSNPCALLAAARFAKAAGPQPQASTAGRYKRCARAA